MATWKWYGQALAGQFGATAARRVDWGSDPLKVLLTTAAYVPDQDAHDFRADVTNEVTGTGYTAGGVAVSGKAVSYDTATNQLRLGFADVVWGPGATISGIRVAVIYKDTGAAATDPLIGYSVLDGDQTVNNGTFTLDVDPTTVLRITADV